MKLSIKNEIINLLYPDGIKCIVCGKEIHPTRYVLCEDCKLDINTNYCVRCGRHKVGIGDYCLECADTVLFFDEARSAVNYTGHAKDLVRRLKYGNSPYLAKQMSEFMLDILLTSDWNIDCITYVPVHKTRLHKRGYNQAELLAQWVAVNLNVPCEKLLDKLKPTVNQASLDREDRIKNLRNTFAAIVKPPKRVLLIDDVMTTGSTVNECAKTLKRAGAEIVYALTFASVPERPTLEKATQNIRDFRR